MERELGQRCGMVMPSFQQGQFLREAIQSVLVQGGNREFEVRDGGSRDDSVAILRSFGDSLRWRSEPDGGQVAAINAGLQQLRSGIVGYLNSDDRLLPGALNIVEETFARNPAVDVVYGRAWVIDERGAQVRPYPTLPFEFPALVQHCFLCQPATFWRADLHRRFGWFDPACENTFDYEFWLRLALNGVKFLHLPDYLADSREHPSTKSLQNRGSIFREIRRMQLRRLGYCGRNWWEQQLRYWRDESGSRWGRLLPGARDRRMYGMAWLPYVLWRRRLGGPLFYRPGDWRA
jgi:glycosyltransferase involved in cell wall biosynthesis